ncbi:hypothetical protein F53441_13339, partial [Fusarium austroafricanum]
MMRILLDSGADPNRENYWGTTEFSWAILKRRLASRNKEIKLLEARVSLLLDHSTDVNFSGRTWGSKGEKADGPPLIYAAKVGWEWAVKVLLERGADCNATGSPVNHGPLVPPIERAICNWRARLRGESALIYAARQGSCSIVRLLLLHGADTRAKDESGKTALMLAMEEGFEDIQDLLRNPEKVFKRPVLTRKASHVVVAINLVYFAHAANIVGAGSLTRDIAAAVGDTRDSVWYTQVVVIFTTVLGIPVSQAADLWGRKVFLVVLTTFGFVGSIVIAHAHSSSTAIAGFAIVGISYGAQPLLHTILSEVVARKWRPWAQGSVHIAAALGAIVGLLVGGAVTRNENYGGFRTYWYMVAGIYVFATVSCHLLYNPPPRTLQLGLSIPEKLGCLDLMGYAIITPALVLFCMSMAWLQNPYPWADGHVLVTFIVGLFLVLALIAYETLIKKDGMFHHHLFQHRNFALALGCIFIEGIVFLCANNYFSFQVSIFFSKDSFITGAHYTIAFIALAVSSIIGGLWCSRNKSVRLPTIVSFSFFMIFNILMATVSKSTTEAQIWAFPIFLGFGLGICLPALVTAAHFAAPPELIAISSGLMISARSLGGSVGIAVFNAIFSHQFSSNLAPKIADAVLPLGFPEKELRQLIPALVHNNETALHEIHGVSPEIIKAGVDGLLEANRVGFRGVWLMTACLSLVGVL